MRNYILGLLAVVILFLGSVIYKQQKTMICHHFPVPKNVKKESAGTPFYLFLFFSKKDCLPCLVEMVEVLNMLPKQFHVVGMVPREELEDEPEVRRLTGAAFPLYSSQEYKKYLPWYTPTLFGVSPSGKIIFVLPGIQNQMSYLLNFLTSTYGKLWPSFKEDP